MQGQICQCRAEIASMGRLHSLVPSADVVQNLRDTAVLDQYERSIGGGSGAGVVRQNAKTSADREVLLREGRILRKGENAVLLIGARQDDRAVGERLPVNAADQTVAVVVCLTSRAAVAGKREEAAVQNDAALIDLTADDGS